MAVPKKKKSPSRRDHRRAQWKISAPNVIDCPQCTEPMIPHRLCAKCGYYKGREIVQVSS